MPRVFRGATAQGPPAVLLVFSSRLLRIFLSTPQVSEGLLLWNRDPRHVPYSPRQAGMSTCMYTGVYVCLYVYGHMQSVLVIQGSWSTKSLKT